MHIDTREQDAVPFPDVFTWWRGPHVTPIMFKVKTVRARLEWGDYALGSGGYRWCAIETKRSLRELANNFLGPDWDRQQKALDKLRLNCKYPFIFVECGLSDLLEYRGMSEISTRYNMPSPKAVLDTVLREAIRRGIPVWCVGGMRSPGARRELGDMILRVLMSYTYGSRLDAVDAAIIEAARSREKISGKSA